MAPSNNKDKKNIQEKTIQEKEIEELLESVLNENSENEQDSAFVLRHGEQVEQNIKSFQETFNEKEELFANFTEIQLDGLYNVANWVFESLKKYSVDTKQIYERDKTIKTIERVKHDPFFGITKENVTIGFDSFQIDNAAILTIGYLQDENHTKFLGYKGGFSKHLDWLIKEYFEAFIQNKKKIEDLLNENKKLEEITKKIEEDIFVKGIVYFLTNDKAANHQSVYNTLISNLLISYSKDKTKGYAILKSIEEKLDDPLPILKNYFLSSFYSQFSEEKLLFDELLKEEVIKVESSLEQSIKEFSKTKPLTTTLTKTIDLGEIISKELEELGISLEPLKPQQYTYHGENTEAVKVVIEDADPAKKYWQKHSDSETPYENISIEANILLHKITESISRRRTLDYNSLVPLLSRIENNKEKEVLQKIIETEIKKNNNYLWSNQNESESADKKSPGDKNNFEKPYLSNPNEPLSEPIETEKRKKKAILIYSPGKKFPFNDVEEDGFYIKFFNDKDVLRSEVISNEISKENIESTVLVTDISNLESIKKYLLFRVRLSYVTEDSVNQFYKSIINNFFKPDKI